MNWKQRKIDWVSHYWNLEHPHRKAIVDILRKHRAKSVLEIGCGAGANLFNIKLVYPEINVAGCDINSDAIATAKKQFMDNAHLITVAAGVEQVEYEENPITVTKRKFGMYDGTFELEDVEFKVGDVKEIPFHGDTYDLVLTDALLIYISPDKIDRALREIRRVGYNKFMFVELHSKSWLARNLERQYFVYDYEKLLKQHNFKHIRITKITKEMWPAPRWSSIGAIITCIR